MSYEIAQQRIAKARRTNLPHPNHSNPYLEELLIELFQESHLHR